MYRNQLKNIVDFIDELKQIKNSLPTSTIIESEEFKSKLKSNIKSGLDTDWCWNGEEEYQITTFDGDLATRNVLNLLKESL